MVLPARGVFNVAEFGAVGDGTTDDKQKIQNAIDAAGSSNTARQINFEGHKTYTISGPLVVKYDATTLNLQGATIKARTGWAGNALINLGRYSGETQAIDHLIIDGYLDLNSKACDGISNIYDATYNPTGFDTTNKPHKFGHISRVRFKNNADGQAFIYLRNLENMWEFFHNQLDPILGTGSYGLRLENQGHNGGNISILNNMIATQATSCTNSYGIYIKAVSSPYNRVKICGNHLFCGNDGTGNTGIYGEVIDGGGPDSDRSWMIFANGIEDWKYGVYLKGATTGSGTGISGCFIFANSIECKNPTYESGNRMIYLGTNVQANVFANFICGKTSAVGETDTGIELDSTQECKIFNNEFDDKTGTGTFVPVLITSGTTHVLYDNRGDEPYNPIGTISTPWPAATGNLTNSSAAQAFPTNNATYTVKFTRKRITISGGTVTQIQINGTNVGSTSGSWILEPGETIRVTQSSNPTAVVYGL